MKVKALIYCTKATKKNDYLIKNYLDEYVLVSKYLTDTKLALNGKIVCECEVETEKINSLYHSDSNYSCYDYITFQTDTIDSDTLEKRSCLVDEQLEEYLGSLELDKVGYALHISNIKVFDKPRELSDYCRITKSLQYEDEEEVEEITKAPQNMCMVYDYVTLTNYVLISVRPQWVCKILNGEKDIEVRRKVLKGMCD